MSADDAAVGYEQARLLRTTMAAAGIDRTYLWLYYFGIGGDASEFEVDAYLHHSVLLPRLQRDLLAHAANEIVVEFTPPRAPSASDVLTARACATGGPADAEGEARSARDSDVMDRDEPEAPGA